MDSASATPPYEQVRTAVIEAVHDGHLAPGARLPTVRDLAGRLGLAVNTVARSYRELETAGVIETRGRQGTFVARHDPTDAAMAAAARIYADAARALGVGLTQARAYLDAEFGGQPDPGNGVSRSPAARRRRGTVSSGRTPRRPERPS